MSDSDHWVDATAYAYEHIWPRRRPWSVVSTDETQDVVLGFDPGRLPSRSAVVAFSIDTDGRWRQCWSDELRDPYRLEQRRARRVRMARKRRRGWA